MDEEVERIKDEHYAAIRTAEAWMIVRQGERFQIQHWTLDGVAPQSSYADTYDAAARLLQLLGIKRPVYPQDWPEAVQIGSAE